jgi:hypothetical protein
VFCSLLKCLAEFKVPCSFTQNFVPKPVLFIRCTIEYKGPLNNLPKLFCKKKLGKASGVVGCIVVLFQESRLIVDTDGRLFLLLEPIKPEAHIHPSQTKNTSNEKYASI